MEQIPQNIRLNLKEAKDLLEKGGRESSERAREILLDMPDAANYSIYHKLLAKSAQELGQAETAIAHLSKSIELDPTDVGVLIRVAEYQLKSDNTDNISELLKASKAAFEKNPNPKLGAKLGALLLKANQIDQAIQFLDQLLKLSPNDPEVVYTLGLAHRENNNDQEYEKQALSAIERTPLDGSIKQRLALVKYYLNKQLYGKALGLLSPLKDIESVKYPNERIADVVNLCMAFSLIHINSYELAQSHLVAVNNQSSLTANYVWACLQIADGQVPSAHRSILAINSIVAKKIDQLAKRKDRAHEMITVTEKAATIRKAQKILKVETSVLQKISQLNINEEKASLDCYLATAYQLFINSIPG